jgi:hypothetical protein
VAERPDYRHIELILQHRNMQALGRDQPIGVWMILNGHHRELLEPGQLPLDWISDIAHGEPDGG